MLTPTTSGAQQVIFAGGVALRPVRRRSVHVLLCERDRCPVGVVDLTKLIKNHRDPSAPAAGLPSLRAYQRGVPEEIRYHRRQLAQG